MVEVIAVLAVASALTEGIFLLTDFNHIYSTEGGFTFGEIISSNVEMVVFITIVATLYVSSVAIINKIKK